MANEKNWHYKHNIDTDGGSDTVTAQNWMYEFYTFLSGGADPSYDPAGAAIAAWEIISASNGSSVVPGNVGWTGPSDVTFAVGDHSWFVARKNILPISTANPDGYVWLTVDCENADDEYAEFLFQHTEPNFAQASPVANRPVEALQSYQKGTQYRHPYDAGQVSFFNGIMDQTGSFVVWSSRNFAGQQNYPFSMACIRLETPRIGEVDPYPLFMKCAWSTSANDPNNGVWDASDLQFSTTNYGNQGTQLSRWDKSGAQGMWDENGTANTSTGNDTMILFYSCVGAATRGPQFNMDSEGSDIDGTYPRLPCFIANNHDNSTTEVRGRFPDITTSVNGELSGLVTPQTGSITACMMGNFFFPATASMLPGV
jgi:hypothetical protein